MLMSAGEVIIYHASAGKNFPLLLSIAIKGAMIPVMS